MRTVNISKARRFSLDSVQVGDLAGAGGMDARLVCFEAGQSWQGGPEPVIYQVLEGEALLRAGASTERVGKGRLAALEAGETHAVENAGGGLLVVLAVRQR